MELRFHKDPETDLPHIHSHGVSEQEVWEVMTSRRSEDLPARDARMKVGQTMAGRYLQVIFVPDDVGDGVFVITAYELRGKKLKGHRRRQRRKPR